jgi:hypothetical protein
MHTLALLVAAEQELEHQLAQADALRRTRLALPDGNESPRESGAQR